MCFHCGLYIASVLINLFILVCLVKIQQKNLFPLSTVEMCYNRKYVMDSVALQNVQGGGSLNTIRDPRMI